MTIRGLSWAPCLLLLASCTSGGAGVCSTPKCAEGGTFEAGVRAARDAGGDGDAQVEAGLPDAALVEDVLGPIQEAADAPVVLVDARPAKAYEAGHVEGALWLDVASLRTTVDGVPGQLLPLPALAEAVGAAGITPEMPLVVYADATDLTAARLFWSLEVLGHPFVALLDGGFDAWSAARLPVSTGPVEVVAADYSDERAVAGRRVDATFVFEHLDDPDVVLVDARSASEYDAGHIPGARNFDWQHNVADGRLKPLDELTGHYEALPDDATLVTYCQTGSRAAMAYFVLRQLGYPDVRLYDGSMAEWEADPALPVE